MAATKLPPPAQICFRIATMFLRVLTCACLFLIGVSVSAVETSSAAISYPDVTIENATARVVISTRQASISAFELKGSHPITLPKHLERKALVATGPGDDGKPALALLGAFVEPITPRTISDGTNQHAWMRSDFDKSTFWGITQNQAPAWTVGTHTDSAATLNWADSKGVVYAVTYTMHATLPQVAVLCTVLNQSPATLTLTPAMIPIKGVHQDYGPNEAAYLAAFIDRGGAPSGSGPNGSAASDSTLGETVSVSITDPTSISAESPLKAVAESGQKVGFVGIKSRFFAAWWTPGTLTLDGTPAAQSATTAMSPDNELNGTAAATAASNGPRWRADVTSFTSTVYGDHQAKLWITYVPMEVPVNRTLSLTWTLTASSMTKKDLAAFGPAEQRIEMLDFMHRFFIIFTRPLIWLLEVIVSGVGSYAIAVILLTLLVKTLMFRLTWAQHSSMIKMQKLAPELKYIQEQYKNDKTKLGQKQMELWKKNGVNPLGGCLPLLVQIPIFIGLYNAFQYNADMRGASFLWISDLTLPDQLWGMPIALLQGWVLSLNPLPIMYIAVTIWMSLTTPMPTNGDPQQEQMAKTMRWMPVLFGVIFYNMPAGLVLYFTVNAVLSTIEVKFIRRRLAAK